MQGPLEFLLTCLLAAVFSQQDVYQGSFSLNIPAHNQEGNNFQLITYPDNAPQQQQGQLYAVSHAQQEEVHRKELLEIERQQNELQRQEQGAQQQEVHIQQQEVQIQQQDLDRNHHQIERQNQVQVQLQQRPGKQQGLLEQNQQQQFIFQKPQQQQFHQNKPLLQQQQKRQQQQVQRKQPRTENGPHLVVFRKSQSQQEFFKGQRQKDLAEKRQFQQDQPRSLLIQRQTQFQQSHPRSQFVQRQLQLEQNQQKSQFFQQKPQLQQEQLRSQFVGQKPRLHQDQPQNQFVQRQAHFQVFRQNLQSSEFKLNLNLVPHQQDFQQIPPSSVSQFQQNQPSSASGFDETQPASVSQFQTASQGRLSENRRQDIKVAQHRPAAARPASSPTQQIFANFSPSRLPSAPSVGQRDTFQAISAVALGPAPNAPTPVHTFLSQPETLAGSDGTETSAGDHVPELSRFQLFQLKKKAQEAGPEPKKRQQSEW